MLLDDGRVQSARRVSRRVAVQRRAQQVSPSFTSEAIHGVAVSGSNSQTPSCQLSKVAQHSLLSARMSPSLQEKGASKRGSSMPWGGNLRQRRELPKLLERPSTPKAEGSILAVLETNHARSFALTFLALIFLRALFGVLRWAMWLACMSNQLCS